MRKSNSIRIMILTVVISCGVLSVGGARAVDEGDPPRENILCEGVDLDLLLDSPSSEMRDVLERYATDRSALNRFHGSSASAARREQMRRFHSDWLDRLREIEFDALGQDGRIDHKISDHIINGAGSNGLAVRFTVCHTPTITDIPCLLSAPARGIPYP